MGFVIGCLIGVTLTIGGLAFLAVWFCRRDRAAAARALTGLAIVLAHQDPRRREDGPSNNGESKACADRD